MRVDEMKGEMLRYWGVRAAARLAELRGQGVDTKVCRISFKGSAPDPLGYTEDTVAVILGLKVNLTFDYGAQGQRWTARCGWPGLREISTCGDTDQEAVTRLFVAVLIGREVSTSPLPYQPSRPTPAGVAADGTLTLNNRRGEAPGGGLPDWPEDAQTFRERAMYQRGVRDGRMGGVGR